MSRLIWNKNKYLIKQNCRIMSDLMISDSRILSDPMGSDGFRQSDIIGFCYRNPTGSDDIWLSETIGSHRISSVSDCRNPIGSDCRIMSDFVGPNRIRWGGFDLGMYLSKKFLKVVFFLKVFQKLKKTPELLITVEHVFR